MKAMDVRKILADRYRSRPDKRFLELIRIPRVAGAIDYLAEVGCSLEEIGVLIEVAVSEHKLMNETGYWAWDAASPADRRDLSNKIASLLRDLHSAMLRSALPHRNVTADFDMNGCDEERALLELMTRRGGTVLLNIADAAAGWPDRFLWGVGKHDEFRKRRSLVFLVAGCMSKPTVRRWAWVTTCIVNALMPEHPSISERAVRRIYSEATIDCRKAVDAEAGRSH